MSNKDEKKVKVEGSEVEFNKIGLKYGSANASEYVIHDLSITVKPNNFFVIVGPSGCGKTTLLRLVAGFLKPSQPFPFSGFLAGGIWGVWCSSPQWWWLH